MEMVKTEEPVWHKINKLDAIRQFVMCNETRHVLENWGIKYLNIRMDMTASVSMFMPVDQDNGVEE